MSPILSRNGTPKDPKRTELYQKIAEDHRQRWEGEPGSSGDGQGLLGPEITVANDEKDIMTIQQEEEDDDPDIRRIMGSKTTYDDTLKVNNQLRVSFDEVDDLVSDLDSPLQLLSVQYPPKHIPTPLSPQARLNLSFILFSQATPSLLLSLLGLIFTGQLLDHLARWQVFKRVDELFILVPILTNLKGNLETCLGAKLGTAANQDHLDTPASRKPRIITSLSLLQLQALTISALAGLTAFLLGLATTHRIIETESTIPPGTLLDSEDWGYTPPGWKELGFVISVGMITAGLSAGVLGTFMTSLVVFAKWMGVDPDNIVAPLAACLGDFLTLFILALIGAALVSLLGTPLVMMLVIAISMITFGFGVIVRRQQREERLMTMKLSLGMRSNGEPKEMEQGGWSPLIAAMFISSATGLVIDRSVGSYQGFGLLVVGMTGIAGGIGSIHASRLSTTLHLREAAPRRSPPQLSPLEGGITLFATSIPVCLFFIGFVKIASWIDIEKQLLLTFIPAYLATVAISIVAAHWMTRWCWKMRLDPDSYVLPIQSAAVDVVGGLLLVLAYEVASWAGGDVKMVRA